MIRQHNATRTDTKRRRLRGNVANQNRRRGTGDSRHVVMLGDPETRESPPFRVLGQVQRIVKRFRDGASYSNGGKIEDREARLAKGWHNCLDVLMSSAAAARFEP